MCFSFLLIFLLFSDYIIPKYPKIFRWIQILHDGGGCRIDGNTAGSAKLLHGGNGFYRDLLLLALCQHRLGQHGVSIAGNEYLLDPAVRQRLAQLLDADDLVRGT